jgi:NADPH-dependent stearoyl-CoA 9-desaturase
VFISGELQKHSTPRRLCCATAVPMTPKGLLVRPVRTRHHGRLPVREVLLDQGRAYHVAETHSDESDNAQHHEERAAVDEGSDQGACDGEQWRHSHNVTHHTYTNILGKDRDLGYSLLRMTDAQRWKPCHWFQPLANLMLAMGFQYGVGSHDLEIGRYKHGAMPNAEFKARLNRFLSKTGKRWFKDYLLFPALALWSAPRVLAGNFAANLIRNLWTYVIYREEDTRNETRGDWYLRQLSGSSNLEGGRFFHLMSGHLSHQIEHHLFPDMPAHRYPDVAPKIQALCAKYGLFYNTGSLFRQYLTVMKRILTYTLPPRSPAPTPA